MILIGEKHAEAKIGETIKSRGDYSNVKHRTIFHDLIDSKTLPEEDKSLARFGQEAQLLLVAGTATTATALASAIVYLLLDEKRLVVLMEELETAMPDITRPAKEAELEALPYLVRPTSPSLSWNWKLMIDRAPSSKKLFVSYQGFHTVLPGQLQLKHCNLANGQFHQMQVPFSA